jgi:virulence-associated protein VagC
MKNLWQTLLDSLHKFSSDFMTDREQPVMQEREDIF